MNDRKFDNCSNWRKWNYPILLFFFVIFSSKTALVEKQLVQERQRCEKIYRRREKKNTDIKKLATAERFCKQLQQRQLQKLTGRSQIF